jgi:hypothetical protein
VRTKKEIRRDVKDQAEQIMYFEASMPDINKATKMLAERLESLYYAGYNDATDKMKRRTK